MTRARLVAVPGLLGLAVALAWPLGATPAYASGLDISIDRPGTSETVSGSSTVLVSGTVTPAFLARVDDIQVRILRGGSPVAGGSACDGNCGSSNPTPYSFTSSLTTNGLYTVRISATGTAIASLLTVDGAADRDFAMAVPPAAPTGVTATALDDRRVKVTWNPVSHPDLRGYVVYRKAGPAGFVPIKGLPAATTTFTDPETAAAGGTFQYHVVSFRNGPVASDDANQWLRSSPSAAAAVTVSAPPTTAGPPGAEGTTPPPGGGLQEGGAASADLSKLFPTSSATIPPPQSSPVASLPDTGFSQTLPFGATTAPGKVDGRSPGRPSSASASGDLSAGNRAGSDTNRRALLVPVAAGSVLCVAALHLRWLNRRLGAFPVALEGGLAGDLPHAEIERGVFDIEREPIGAGVGTRLE